MPTADKLDKLTARLDQGRDTAGGEGRNQSVALQVDVDLAVPTAPRLGRGEHASTTAHVTVRTLAGTVGTTAADTRDTGHSATGTPRFGRRLVTGGLAHGVRLATVAAHQLRHLVHHIRTDRGLENCRQGNSLILHRLIFVRVHTDQRARCRQTLKRQTHKHTRAHTGATALLENSESNMNDQQYTFSAKEQHSSVQELTIYNLKSGTKHPFVSHQTSINNIFMHNGAHQHARFRQIHPEAR